MADGNRGKKRGPLSDARRKAISDGNRGILRPNSSRAAGRATQTDQERTLLSAFARLGIKAIPGFELEQLPCGRYCPDIFLPEYNLFVEVDGSIHHRPEMKAREPQRDAAIRAEGFHLVRVTNAQVEKDPDAIVRKILPALPLEQAASSHRYFSRKHLRYFQAHSLVIPELSHTFSTT